MSSPIRFYNPDSETQITHNHLPHWEQMGATYFVTFRLADSVPAEALKAYVRERNEWLAKHPQPPWPPEIEREYRKKFTGRFERWLDRGYGACHLRMPECSRIVEGALRHFEGEKCRVHSWVIMPNHVHILVSTIGEVALSELVKSWKGFTARQINLHLGLTGSLWQKSYFDRLIRDWNHFKACADYIRQNPVKADLPGDGFLLGESEMIRKLLA